MLKRSFTAFRNFLLSVGGNEAPAPSRVPLKTAVLRGLFHRCPHCGQGPAFAGYVKVVPRCKTCGSDLDNYRSDDAPAYFTIAIVGHVIVPGMLILERTAHPATWVHMTLWLPLTLAMTLILLPRIKGALLGVQWALHVKG